MAKHNSNLLFLFIFAGIGFFIGAIFGGTSMAVAFSFVGILTYYIRELRSHTQYLDKEVEKLNHIIKTVQKESTLQPKVTKPDAAKSDSVASVVTESFNSNAAASIETTPTDISSQTLSEPLMAQKDIKSDPFLKSESPDPRSEPSQDPGRQIIQTVKDFFTKGNVVVKVGVIIFFFGIGFLIKFASENSLLPIELRLVFSGVCGIVLLAIGYRLRKTQKAYSTVLQGAGIGVLYLTVFGAAKLYALMPMGLAFFIMVAIVVFSCILAVLQDAKALAIFGIVGGFLSPILMSTGTGSHVALFSYYALLNLGIFGTAWFKSWRILNLVGFFFTFVIGFLWGYKYYQPQYFSTTEPFLIIHFLFYAFISVLFAVKQPVKLKGYIDGTLVFGLPVVVFALQSALVKNMEFGMAFSALGAGAFYILLCFGLWKQTIEGMKLLCESFLALGVVFLSLAIPFAFDSGWTSGIWALEGAGILWVGLRQNRNAPRYFGILLQLAAAGSFIVTYNSPAKDIPIANAIFLSCLSISVAGLLSNYFLNIYGWSKKINEKKQLFLIPLFWGLAWWFAGALIEIDLFVPYKYKLSTILAVICASGMIFSTLRLKLRWNDIEYPLFALPYVCSGLSLLMLLSGRPAHPCADFAWAAFTLVFLTQYHILFWHEKNWEKRPTGYMHRATLYLFIVLLCWQMSWFAGEFSSPDTVWEILPWVIVPAIFILSLIRWGKTIKWPVAAFEKDYCQIGLYPVAAFLAFFIVTLFFNPANPLPLPYLPIINPGEMVQILGILTLIKWVAHLKKIPQFQKTQHISYTAYTISAITFVWLNTIIARSIHYWYNIAFSLDDMLNSVIFQASISILWTIIALAGMVFANKKSYRHVWFTGAVLLALVVLKLFLIDLVEIDTIARIVSFLVVGVLMLIIGYFSPLPPKPVETTS